MQRQIVERTRNIDITNINRLKQGNYVVTWGDNASIDVNVFVDRVALSYYYEEKHYKIIINYNQTKVGYGYRKWFVCPSCKRNTSKLYNMYGSFACRVCHKLTYRSSNASGNELKTLAYKIRKIQRRLKADIDICINEWNISKPKNMHWITYHNLWEKLRHLQTERDNVWAIQAISVFNSHY